MHWQAGSLGIAVATALLSGPVLADDVDAFLVGTTRTCVGCDLSGRQLKERDFRRAKLDQTRFKNADLGGASLFRASLVRADFSGAKLKQANLNLVDAKW